MTIGLLSFVGMIVFIVMSFISKVKKNGKTKKNLLIAGSCFVLMAVCASLDDTPVENQVVEKEETKEVAVAKEKEDKVDKEEVKKKKAEEKLRREEEKKKEELLKQEAAKKKAEEDKKKAEEEQAKAEADAKALAEKLAKEKADKKVNAQTIPYAQLKKNPDRYSGEYVKYTGEIVQILEGDDMTNIRLSVTKESYGYSYDDIVFIEYIGYTDFVDGDIVTIYGEVYGDYSYESQAGYNISLPGIIADEVLIP